MKTIIITILTFSGSATFAQSQNDRVQGDFDGNGKKEYVYVKFSDCSDECDGKCDTTIYFSDKNIKPFTISMAKGGELYNLGDLNNDGKDDLAFIRTGVQAAGIRSILIP